MATKPLQVRLDPDLRELLEEAAREAGLPLSSYARHLIRMGLGAPGERSAAIESVWAVRSLLRHEMEGVSQEIARIIEERVVKPFRDLGAGADAGEDVE